MNNQIDYSEFLNLTAEEQELAFESGIQLINEPVVYEEDHELLEFLNGSK